MFIQKYILFRNVVAHGDNFVSYNTGSDLVNVGINREYCC